MIFTTLQISFLLRNTSLVFFLELRKGQGGSKTRGSVYLFTAGIKVHFVTISAYGGRGLGVVVSMSDFENEDQRFQPGHGRSYPIHELSASWLGKLVLVIEKSPGNL
ncbi:hypothetical protein ACF0H5_008495 [Mactra antiquata]